MLTVIRPIKNRVKTVLKIRSLRLPFFLRPRFLPFLPTSGSSECEAKLLRSKLVSPVSSKLPELS